MTNGSTLAEQSAQLRDGAAARALDDAVMVLRGDDRLDWLAGIVTQDVKSLAPGQSRYAAIVHEKGKILADAWVLSRRDEALLVVPRRTVEPLRAHFDRHIVMEDVDVSVADDLRVWNVSGRGCRIAPDGDRAFATDRIGWGGVDVLGAEAPTEIPVVEDAAWDVARLEAGVPRFGVDFDEENYVQEASITDRAVSFHKGCYIGQEVVCRLQMRGHVRRQLVALTIEGEPPPRGTAVGEVGSITSSAWSPALNRSVALAMLKWDVAQRGGEVAIGSRRGEIVSRPLAG